MPLHKIAYTWDCDRSEAVPQQGTTGASHLLLFADYTHVSESRQNHCRKFSEHTFVQFSCPCAVDKATHKNTLFLGGKPRILRYFCRLRACPCAAGHIVATKTASSHRGVDWVVVDVLLRCPCASKNPTDRQENSESSGAGTGVCLASERHYNLSGIDH